MIDNLAFENEQLNRSTLQQQIHQELRRAGVDLYSEEGQRIAELTKARFDHKESIKAEKEALKQQNKEAEENKKQMQQLGQQIGGIFAGVFTGFISDLRNGKSATEALRNALTKLADQLLSMIAQKIFTSLFGNIFGGIAGLSGGGPAGGGGGGGPGFASGGPVRRYASGGFVSGPGGPKADKIPAMLSDGEYVINAAATKKFGPLLAAINTGRFNGFADGGKVGGGVPMASAANNNSAAVQNVINVKVEAGAGTGDPQKDQALGASVAKQLDAVMRTTVIDEIQRQQRSGGILDRRTR